MDKNKNNPPTILVIGDVMLDSYLQLRRTAKKNTKYPRIYELNKKYSRKDAIKYTLGGAGNVAANLASLSANVILISKVGKDCNSQIIKELMEDAKITADFVEDDKFITILKQRINLPNLGRGFRIDIEDENDYRDCDIEHQIMSKFYNWIDHIDLLIISDYGKGVFCKGDLAARLIAECNRNEIPVFVDPKQFDSLVYKGATLLKPNKKEFEGMVDFECDDLSDEELFTQCQNNILNETGIENVLLTRKHKGALLINNSKYVPIEAKSRQPIDANGAGDTMISVIAYFYLLNDGSITNAVKLSSCAVKIVIEQKGTNLVSNGEILKMCKDCADTKCNARIN